MRANATWVVWRLIRHRPGLFALHFGAVTALAYVLPLLPALVVRELLDGLTGGEAAGATIATFAGMFVAVGAAHATFEAFGMLATNTVRHHSYALLRRNTLSRILQRPGARALPSSPGDALVRMRADPEALGHAVDFIADPLGQVVAYVFSFAVLGSIDWFLTLAVVVPAVAVLFAVNLATPRIHEARRRRQEAHGDVGGLLGDAFASVASIKAAGAEDRVTRKLQELNDTRRRETLRDLLVEQVMQSLSANAATIATGVLLVVLATRPRGQSLTAGDLAVFTSYLHSLGRVVGYGSVIVTSMRQADVSITRMAELLQGAPPRQLVAPPAIRLGGRPPTVPAITKTAADRLERLDVRGLTFAYPENGRGIDDVTLSIERNEFVVITGMIGSGKTTLVRALLGLLPADDGEIAWNGERVADAASFLIPPRCAYTPQVPRLFSMPLRDNVLLGHDGDLDGAARAAVLEEDLALLDHGWDTLVGPRGTKLSGGQAQRVAAARMFVRDAELLVFDDVSSALDVDTEARLWDRLFERGDVTCLVVSHRRAALQRADRVVVLRDGRVEDVVSRSR